MAASLPANRVLSGLSGALRPLAHAVDGALLPAGRSISRHVAAGGSVAARSVSARYVSSEAASKQSLGRLGLSSFRVSAGAERTSLRHHAGLGQLRCQSSGSGSSEPQNAGQRRSDGGAGLAADMLKQKMASEGSREEGTKAEGEQGAEGQESAEDGKGAPPPEQPAGNPIAAWASIIIMGGVGVVLVTGWPGQGDSWTSGWLSRSGTSLKSFYKYYSEPTAEKLLPDPLPEPYNRPYTLVINMNDTLVHMDWSREHGWRAAKRPGIDYFVAYLSQLYEIVVFTSGPAHNAAPVLDKLDPYGYIMYRLYRDATRYENGEYVKDLEHLNRDLAKTVAIDINEKALKNQPDNLIVLNKWEGDPNDSALLDIIPFLETLALSGVDDVRPVLKSYQGKDIPTTFAEWQKKLRADYEEKQRRVLGQYPAAAPARGGFLSRLLGGAAAPVVQQTPPNPFDIIEAQTRDMREQFLKEQEQFRRQAEEQRRAQIEEMERQMAEMKNKKMSLVGWFQQQAGGPQPGQQ